MAPAMSTATVLVRGLGALADVAANTVVRRRHITGGPMVWLWTRSRRSRTHVAAPAAASGVVAPDAYPAGAVPCGWHADLARAGPDARSRRQKRTPADASRDDQSDFVRGSLA
ncbi:hypothetical protein ZWY2020_049497 [Hordeum vulgare]|nr:hypothetical protein ZWY2020_049497 [Hordeum vulgare]